MTVFNLLVPKKKAKVLQRSIPKNPFPGQSMPDPILSFEKIVRDTEMMRVEKAKMRALANTSEVCESIKSPVHSQSISRSV